MMVRISVGKIRERITDSVSAKTLMLKDSMLGKQRHLFMVSVHLCGKGEKMLEKEIKKLGWSSGFNIFSLRTPGHSSIN